MKLSLNNTPIIEPLILSSFLSIFLWQFSTLSLTALFTFSLISFFIGCVLYKLELYLIIRCLWGSASAFVGMLMGVMIDFGVVNVVLLYELCSQGGMATTAPATLIGMLLGCNLGFFLTTPNKIHPREFLICNLGMLIGMQVFSILIPSLTFLDSSLAILFHLLFMVASGELFNKTLKISVIKSYIARTFST